LRSTLVSSCGGRALRCATFPAVSARTVLKPAAVSMSSLVLVVLQPIAKAASAPAVNSTFSWFMSSAVVGEHVSTNQEGGFVECRLTPPTPIGSSSPGSPDPPRVLVHFRGAQLLLCHLILQAELLILLVLRLLADIQHVVLWIREGVIERPVSLDS